jgi:hypothetical protein
MAYTKEDLLLTDIKWYQSSKEIARRFKMIIAFASNNVAKMIMLFFLNTYLFVV